MCKVNLEDYIEQVVDVDAWGDELFIYPIDKDYKKFEKIKPKKHHFKENVNIERIRDKQKNHRVLRTDKKI